MVGRPLRTIIADTVGSAQNVIVVNPARETIRELVTTLDELDAPPAVDVLANERALKDEMDDFLIGSLAADLIDADILTIRVLDDPPVNSLLVTSEAVVSVVEAGSTAAGLGTAEESFVEATRAFYDERWDEADPFTLRTPPLTAVRSTLEDELGAETVADFDAVLDSLSVARGDGDGLDEVTISLLVAARNEQLLYDISKWGEDVGLASKATFSRTKTQLEDRGLLDTEKVPIDVGRPRLRLLLGTDALREADASELAEQAMAQLR
ncbi:MULTISPECIES: transcriptional regulator TbsP [unclassified Halorhabdus]|uniref:transcriptional regulator TbsP n=1 Tax=unclassified Halorhabdus TaxID=2621901 RepID=UPI001E6177C2|nr:MULTISPECIES: DUF5821 family protein [unclassified Halorhabdus]